VARSASAGQSKIHAKIRAKIHTKLLAAVLVLAAPLDSGRAGAADSPADASAPPKPAASVRSTAAPVPTPADLATILAAVRAPGARAVLVNLWATWCDPCREEMPDLIRFYRAHRAEGLRLVLVSADDPGSPKDVARFLVEAGATGAQAFIKTGDDMVFINGLDARWSGALPASFLYDGRGGERRFWPGRVTLPDLEAALAQIAPATKRAPHPKTKGHP
jgi:thiol-disulfide isomerase/thioredoxin